MSMETMTSARATARALGWFSIGLGLAEVLMTRRLARAIGMRGQEATLRACGLREIANGAAILVASNPAPFVWARVAGDGLDLAALGGQALMDERQSSRAAVAALAVAGVTAADLACAQALQQPSVAERASRYDYAGRSGLPRSPAQMRGAARDDFVPPDDMRVPAALRAYGAG